MKRNGRDRALLRRPAIHLLASLFLLALPVAAQKHYKELQYPRLKDLRLPRVDRTVLPNGLVLYLVEDHALPKVEGLALVRTGARFEPADKVGLASITGQVMRTGGTQTRTGDEINRLLENAGALVETSIDTEAATASVFALPENLPLVLEILADLLRNPVFPDDKIELAKVQERTAIARRNDDVGTIANREFFKLLYGSDSPYARHTEYQSIESVIRDDLVAFHRRSFHPNQTLLGLWGDFDAKAVKALVQTHFGSWPRRELPLPPVPGVEEARQGSVNVIPKDDVNQTNLRIGHLGGRLDDPDYYALNVLGEILGGGLPSRLFRRVRSDLGLAYAARGGWNADYDHRGALYIRVDTKSGTTVRAIEEVVKQVRLLTEEPVGVEELRVAKEGILNSFVFNFDTTGEVVQRVMRYEYYGYPRDFLDTFKSNIEQVTVEDVLRAARAHIHPDKLVILAVGRQQDFDRPLSALGEVRTLDVSIPPAKPKQAALPPLTPESEAKGRLILQAAVRGAGGVEALHDVRDVAYLTKITQLTPQGELALTSKSSVLLPNKLRQDVVLPFGELTLTYDGERAWAKGPQGIRDLPPRELENLRKRMARALPILLRDAHAGNRTVQFLETTAVDDTEVDVILVTDAEDDAVRLYVERSTGHVVRESFQGNSPFVGPVEEDQLFSDFRPVGALIIPFKIVTLHNGQKASEAMVVNYEVNTGLDPALFARQEVGEP